MDTHVFANLAQIRILLVPIGAITQQTFEKYASEIRSFDAIRLGDIAVEGTKDERARFQPKSLATGYLHLTLSLLRPSHFPLAIIGVATCSRSEALPEIISQFHDTALDMFPPTGIYPLARNCFVFEEGSSSGISPSGQHPELIIFPEMMGNRKLHIGTLLGEICSKIFGEFGVLIQRLESPLGNEYLNAYAPPLPSHSSQPEISKSALSKVAPVMKRNSSLGVPTVRKRLSAIGAASSHGRLFKDALIWYTEALQLLKSPLDSIWNASALEGMATIPILDAWSAGHGLQTSTSAGREPWSDIADKLTQATTLYFKVPPSEVENYQYLSYLYCCCVLRHTSLLFAIWSAKGWGPLAFTTMLQPGPTPYLPPTLSHSESIPRTTISSLLAQVHGPWLLHLGPRERVSVLEAIASTYSCLGYRRKESYILREVLGCILDLIVCGREEDAHTNMRLFGNKGNVGIRLNESSDGNESILKLLKHVCKVLGVNLDAIQILDDNNDPKNHPEADDDADVYREPFGWPELQIGVVRESVAVAEALPDFLAVAQYALSSLKTLQEFLEPGDQYHLYSTAARAMQTARRRGAMKAVEYWSGRPVVSITLAPLPFIRLPIEKPISALRPRTSDSNAILKGGELLEFIVIVQNPYVFDMELQSLSLSTSGVPFESTPISVIIPARSYHRAVLSGKALTTGTLVVRGCIVRAPGGVAREFVLPLATEDEEERLAHKRSAALCEAGRFKYSGLDNFPWERKRSQTSGSESSRSSKTMMFLECKVVPEQPLLRIRRTTVTHGALMLYDGEMSSIRITFENIAPLPIDFIRLAFDDSTMTPAQQALAEGEMSVFETYETEYALIHRPVFSWIKNDSVTIAPGRKVTLTINCFGKVGCTEGTIHASYSYIHRDPSDNKETSVFHTRQLSYPLMVTVYRMLESHGMDILPYPSYPMGTDGNLATNNSNNLNLFVQDNGAWCLFSVDIMNTYGIPFEVSIERVQEDVPWGETLVNVPPGSTSRLVIPLKKFLLGNEHISRPIPTLSDRQFVVDKTKLSDAEQKMQRELFWYREELFKSLRCQWREAGGTRYGDLSLRQQRLTLTMLKTLRTEKAGIQLSLMRSGNPGKPIEQNAGKYHPPCSEPVYLHIKVTNLTKTTLVFTLDVNIDPREHVIHDGILCDIPVGRLEAKESREIEVAICFLCHGRFEVLASARVLDSSGSSSETGSARLIAMVNTDA
ncbi:transport protein Trs120 or TRAPPC9 TRAPP II complex subunit-domain-containing protein [Lentinula edodes]|uniref:Transport protein Trs120 or TRAPPC9 TRAPP II complex subunit-domain-containing protein n=1 Tax=Lentinula lateritia TaxID=40482 RepID=A0A9W8ZX48_9AGAR|nr:transport protein Trs120 or TRAPPC9 TRAPP II complex subunit-domain-containing protein [Lentinula edodes]